MLDPAFAALSAREGAGNDTTGNAVVRGRGSAKLAVRQGFVPSRAEPARRATPEALTNQPM
jgi:hypothetical protein